MFEKLKTLLRKPVEDLKEEKENYNTIWQEKCKFVGDILLENSKYMHAIADANKKRGHYRKRLAELENISLGVQSSYGKALEDKSCKPSEGRTRNGIIEEDLHVEIFKEFLSPGYETPTNPIGILIHLEVLLGLYSTAYGISEIPRTTVARLDLILARLARSAMVFIAAIDKKGQHFYRTGESTKALRKPTSSKERLKQLVVEEYYKIENRETIKPWTIAGIIKDRLDKKMKDVPSQSTIQRYLKEEGLI